MIRVEPKSYYQYYVNPFGDVLRVIPVSDPHQPDVILCKWISDPSAVGEVTFWHDYSLLAKDIWGHESCLRRDEAEALKQIDENQATRQAAIRRRERTAALAKAAARAGRTRKRPTRPVAKKTAT